MIKMTPLLRRLHKLAKKHHLPNAFGRAIVLANRHYNDGWASNGIAFSFPGQHRNEVLFMRRVRPETARRWLLHWSQGGSIKLISMSQEEWLACRRYKEECRRECRREWAIHLAEQEVEEGQARWSETGSTRKF